MIKHKEYTLTLQAIFIFIAKFIQILFQFLIPVILIRILAQSDYGLYQKVLFLTTLIIPLFRFHLTDSLFYFFPICNKGHERNEIISQTYFQLLAICVFMSIIFIIISPIIESFFHNKNVFKYSYQILAIIFFTVTSSILENIFILEKKSKLVVLFASADKFLRTSLLLIIISIFKNIEYALLALIIHGFFRFLFLTIYLFKNYDLDILLVKVVNLKKQWIYVFPMGLGLFLGVLGKNSDKLILAWLLTDIDFALYSIGNLSIPFIATVYVSIGNVVMPELAKYSINQEFQKTLILWKSMIIKNAIVTLPIILFFIVQANEIFIVLFTDAYSGSANVFRIIILTLLIQMLGYGYILRAFGKTKKILVAKIYRTLLSLIVGYFLISNFGIIGAALTFVFSYFVNAIIQLKAAKKLLQVSWRNYLPWSDFYRLFIISLVPATIIYFINALDWPPIQQLVVNGLIYFSLVFLLLFKFNYFKVFGIEKILNQLRGVK